MISANKDGQRESESDVKLEAIWKKEMTIFSENLSQNTTRCQKADTFNITSDLLLVDDVYQENLKVAAMTVLMLSLDCQLSQHFLRQTNTIEPACRRKCQQRDNFNAISRSQR
jgi:hypothetical protein